MTLPIRFTSVAVFLSLPGCPDPVPKSGTATSCSAVWRVPIIEAAMSPGIGGICTAASSNGKICPGTMRTLPVEGRPDFA